MYLTPKRITPGSRVAIVAPASPFQSDELTESLDIIKELGLVPVLGENVKNIRTDGVHAASVIQRVDELMWAFSDQSISAVIVATGGYGSAGVLPYLDYDIIARSRKPLLGMSDITALNNGILKGARLISINGQSPNIRLDKGQRCMQADTESFRLTLRLMMSKNEWADRPFSINQFTPRTLSPGTATGHVVGGNCDTFTNLIGTPYLPDCEGAILFIEDVHKGGETLARQFLHMQMAGILDKISGVVIGQFADEPRPMMAKEPAIEDVLEEYFTDSVPCVYGYSFSHGDWTIPVPVGAECTMDATTGDVSFRFKMA